jgi:citrate/tricarballylate utilization protein
MSTTNLAPKDFIIARTAASAPIGKPPAAAKPSEAMDAARRNMEICNACRYCEGYCAVFPAMQMRTAFTGGDLNYLANLCHNCQGCFHACQYAPPHEFGVNVPQAFAALRNESYAQYAWPQPMARVFERNGTVVSLVLAAALTIVIGLALMLIKSDALFGVHTGPGAFYKLISWGLMASVAGATFCFSILALTIGGMNFWRDAGPARGGIAAAPLGDAARDILTMKNLGGGVAGGCNDRDESFSNIRRHMHHATFYGFMLCFASTSVATLYDHFLKLEAPYAFWSLPVQLGTWGGVLLMIGTAGQMWMKVATDPAAMAKALRGSDFAFVGLLFLTALTGLLLLAFRGTGAMGVLLAVHLGVILALFLLLPYCKFVHGLYRGLALLRNSIDNRAAAQPKAAQPKSV